MSDCYFLLLKALSSQSTDNQVPDITLGMFGRKNHQNEPQNMNIFQNFVRLCYENVTFYF